jgi:hypothetical protein
MNGEADTSLPRLDPNYDNSLFRLRKAARAVIYAGRNRTARVSDAA